MKIINIAFTAVFLAFTAYSDQRFKFRVTVGAKQKESVEFIDGPKSKIRMNDIPDIQFNENIKEQYDKIVTQTFLLYSVNAWITVAQFCKRVRSMMSSYYKTIYNHGVAFEEIINKSQNKIFNTYPGDENKTEVLWEKDRLETVNTIIKVFESNYKFLNVVVTISEQQLFNDYYSKYRHIQITVENLEKLSNQFDIQKSSIVEEFNLLKNQFTSNLNTITAKLNDGIPAQINTEFNKIVELADGQLNKNFFHFTEEKNTYDMIKESENKANIFVSENEDKVAYFSKLSSINISSTARDGQEYKININAENTRILFGESFGSFSTLKIKPNKFILLQNEMKIIHEVIANNSIEKFIPKKDKPIDALIRLKVSGEIDKLFQQFLDNQVTWVYCLILCWSYDEVTVLVNVEPFTATI